MSDLDVRPARRWGAWIVLFASTGTLLCCALPILLVSVGLGAAVASIVSTLPFLVTLSLYKNWMFAGSLLLLGGAYWAQARIAGSCPVDPVLAEKCRKARRWNKGLLWLASAIWALGFFAAFLLEPFSQLLGY